MYKKSNMLRKVCDFIIFVTVIIIDTLLLVGNTNEYLTAKIITILIGLIISFVMCIVKNVNVVVDIFYMFMLLSFIGYAIFTLSLI